MISAIQLIIFAFAIFALSRAVLRWRERTISISGFFFWTAVWMVLLVLVFIPDITTIISRGWGIGRGIDSILYMSIIALFYLVFRLYVENDSRHQEITKLVRHLAVSGVTKAGRPASKLHCLRRIK